MKCAECGRNMTSMMKKCPSCGWEVSAAPKKEEEEREVAPSAFKGAFVPAQTMDDLKNLSRRTTDVEDFADDAVEDIAEDIVEDVVEDIPEEVAEVAEEIDEIDAAFDAAAPSPFKALGGKEEKAPAAKSPFGQSAGLGARKTPSASGLSAGKSAFAPSASKDPKPAPAKPAEKISDSSSGLGGKLPGAGMEPEPIDKLSNRTSGIKGMKFTASPSDPGPMNSAFAPLKPAEEKEEAPKQPSGIKGVTFTPIGGAPVEDKPMQSAFAPAKEDKPAPEKKQPSGLNSAFIGGGNAPEKKQPSGLNSAFVPAKEDKPAPEKKQPSGLNSAFTAAPKKEEKAEPEKKSGLNAGFAPNKKAAPAPEKKPLGIKKQPAKEVVADVEDMVETSSDEVKVSMNVLQMKPDVKYVYYGDVPVTKDIDAKIEAAISNAMPKQEVDNLPAIVAMAAGAVIVVLGIITKTHGVPVGTESASVVKAIYDAAGMATIGIGLMTAAMGFLKFKR